PEPGAPNRTNRIRNSRPLPSPCRVPALDPARIPHPASRPGPAMPAGTLLYAQSGGVTAVINATAGAVVETARRHRVRVLAADDGRSEEHTSELQSRENLVCRLLLEKKKKKRSA